MCIYFRTKHTFDITHWLFLVFLCALKFQQRFGQIHIYIRNSKRCNTVKLNRNVDIYFINIQTIYLSHILVHKDKQRHAHTHTDTPTVNSLCSWQEQGVSDWIHLFIPNFELFHWDCLKQNIQQLKQIILFRDASKYLEFDIPNKNSNGLYYIF